MNIKEILQHELSCGAILCALALAAMPLVASARPTTEDQRVEKKTIQLNHAATVDGHTLKPGEYQVVVEGNKVRFEQNKMTVLTAPCDWRDMNYKPQYDSTTYSANNALKEIQFAGSSEALEVM